MNTKLVFGLFSMLFAAGLLIGCGGAPAETVTPDEEVPAAPEEAVEEVAAVEEVTDDGVGWKSMAFTERQQYMKETVMPKMKEVFSEDADFNCMECHGDDAKAVNFKMPNTLDPLDPENMPFNSDDEKAQKTAKWMQETVVPEMATLLGTTPYDPASGEGLGCFNCHAKK